MSNKSLVVARAPSSPQQLVDELIFRRDVNEGFLLIDYISGRSEKSLKDLDIDRLEIPGGAPQATTGLVWKKFCEIRYPPAPQAGVRAEHAAFVLDMKDRLTALARPARSITIAYTAIFVGSVSLFLRKDSERQQTQVDQAREAFPSIAWHARFFARLFGLFLPIFLLIWFLLTAFTYWDVGYGGSIVQTLQQLETQRAALLQASGRAAITPEACKPPGPRGPDAGERREACAKFGRIKAEMGDARLNLLDFYQATVGSQHAWYNVIARIRPIRLGFFCI